MKKTWLNSRGLSLLQTVLVVVIIASVGGIGFYVWRQNAGSKQAAYGQQATNPQSTSTTTATTASGTFDIAVFYDKLQTGMTPEQVIKLAGKQPDDCSMTDSVPASQNCFWYSGNKTVNVSYGNKNILQAKSKTGF